MAELYTRKGSPFFYARLRAGEEIRRISTGTSVRRDAQKIADEKERELASEAEAAQRRGSSITLLEAQLRRWNESPVLPSTERRQRLHLRAIKDFFGDPLVSDITLDQIKKFKARRLGETTPLMVANELKHLRILLKSCMNWDVGVDKNLVTSDVLAGLPKAGKRVRYLTEDEYKKLYESVKRPGLKLVLMMGVLTGLRAGEMKSLNWGDIDFDKNIIMVRSWKTKTRIQREVPIPKQLRSTLLSTRERVPHGPDDPVIVTAWGTRYSSIPASVKKICSRIGMTDVSAHILRHTFASWSLQRGVPAIAVQKLLGHSTMSMTSRYSHPGESFLQEVMRDFGTRS